jgi:hypothetical protein
MPVHEDPFHNRRGCLGLPGRVRHRSAHAEDEAWAQAILLEVQPGSERIFHIVRQRFPASDRTGVSRRLQPRLARRA